MGTNALAGNHDRALPGRPGRVRSRAVHAVARSSPRPRCRHGHVARPRQGAPWPVVGPRGFPVVPPVETRGGFLVMGTVCGGSDPNRCPGL